MRLAAYSLVVMRQCTFARHSSCGTRGLLAVGQSRRHAGLVPALHVRLRLLQGLLDFREIGTRLGAVRLRIEAGQDAHADRVHPIERNQLVDHHVVRRGHVGHAVVGQHDQVDPVEQAALLQAPHQSRHRGVGVAQRLVHLRRVRAVDVAGVVDRIEVQGEEVGAFGGRQVQPGQHLVDPLIGVDRAIERLPLIRPMAVDLRFRTGPEHRGACAARAASAVTQIGMPSAHQRPSPTASRLPSENLPSCGSNMVLLTMPW